jgi:hypothetical protein
MKRLNCLSPRVLLLCTVAAIGAAMAAAQTAPTSLFQIDGNAASTPLNTCTYASGTNQLCDYWNLLNGSQTGTDRGSTGSSTVRTFVSGAASTNAFQGGGSKDANFIQQWSYSNTPTPNKDTLNAGYAAAYSAPGTNDFVVMFGADRVSPNGDANIGIWFFQKNVATNGAGGFVGEHVDGDVFVISSFTGGGGNSSISVFAWSTGCASGVRNPTPGQCADTHLKLLASQTASQVCGTSLYCAATNPKTTNSSWEGPIASPLFFQGGVNITKALLNANISQLPCFSSFLEETRSSQSTTAVLKDFISGGFPVCGLHITKACGTLLQAPAVSRDGAHINYTWTGTVQNTGIGTLSDLTVSDALQEANNVTIPLTANLSSTTLAPKGQTGDTATYTVTYSSTATTETNGARATASFGGVSFTSDNLAQATCTLSPTTALTVSKHCTAPGPGLVCGSGGCVVQVPMNAQVCNTGVVAVSGISLTDSPALTLANNGFALAPGQCTGGPGNPPNVTGSYTPTSFTGDGSTNGRYSFSDSISITAATPAIAGALTPIASGPGAGTYGQTSVSCPLCSSGECSGVLP